MTNEPRSESAAPARGPVTEMQPPVEPASLSPIYTNFVRVTGSPEELILDFGLNTDATGSANMPIKISERLVMNYFTAKRLLGALHMAVQQHEGVYGVLETDIQKRMRAGAASRVP